MGETIRGFGNIEHFNNTAKTIVVYKLTINSRPGQPKPTKAQLEQLLVDCKNAAAALNLDLKIRMPETPEPFKPLL